MLNKLLPLALILGGCSATPVIDYRASENPKELIRDELECDHLANKAYTFIWDRTDAYFNCLNNRGHAIVNKD